MATEHALQFILTAEQDSALREKIDALNPATATDEIVKLGAACNFHFSSEEFQTALQSHVKRHEGQISEEELSVVSGGLFDFQPSSDPGRGPGARFVPAHPNTVVSPGTPHPTYWVNHGTF